MTLAGRADKWTEYTPQVGKDAAKRIYRQAGRLAGRQAGRQAGRSESVTLLKPFL